MAKFQRSDKLRTKNKREYKKLIEISVHLGHQCDEVSKYKYSFKLT